VIGRKVRTLVVVVERSGRVEAWECPSRAAADRVRDAARKVGVRRRDFDGNFLEKVEVGTSQVGYL